MMTAGLSGNVDFMPIPSGGAQAVLTAARKLRYIVGQSLKPQWIIVTKPEIKTVEDLKGKTLGYARVGAADYDEGATTLERFFNMKVGRDYKVIQFQGEPERIAALANGDIAARAGLGAARLQAKQAGFNVLLRTGDYLPRAGGTFWCDRGVLPEESRDGEEVHPRHRQGRDVLPRQQAGILRHHEGAPRRARATRRPACCGRSCTTPSPPSCRPISTARFSNPAGIDMIAANQWPKDKPLPDPEQYLARAMLDATLKEMNYVPTKIDAKPK